MHIADGVWSCPETRPTPPTSKQEMLEQRVRESGGLLERLEDCRRRIGKMCSERRSPRMSIPVEWSDDDFFICRTLEDAIEVLKQPAVETPTPPTAPIGDYILVEDMDEGTHPKYGRGLFATYNCIRSPVKASAPNEMNGKHHCSFVPYDRSPGYELCPGCQAVRPASKTGTKL